MQDLVTAAAAQAQARKQNKVTSSHLYVRRLLRRATNASRSKAAITANPTFDFLKSHVAAIPDLAAFDPDAEDEAGPAKKARKPRKDKGVAKGKRAKKGAVEDAADEDAEMTVPVDAAPVDVPVLPTTTLPDEDEDYDAA
jgi:hypothetical protein